MHREPNRPVGGIATIMCRLPNAAHACCTSHTLSCSLIAPSRLRRFAASRRGVRAADNSA